MTSTTITKPQTRRICDERINCAKLEVEAGDFLNPLRVEQAAASSASIDQSEAISGADEHRVHPGFSDEETCARKEDAIMKSEDWEALGFSFEAGSGKMLQIDTSKYQALFDDADLSDDQKEEIILELWKIIIPFVDLGFQVSPLELACGKLPIEHDDAGNQDSAMLKSDQPNLSETFNQFAAE